MPHLSLFHRRAATLAALLLIVLTTTLAASSPSAASTPVLRLVAAPDPRSVGGPIQVEVHVQTAVDLVAWEFDLGYDPALVRLIDVETAPAFGREVACTAGQRCALTLGPRPTLGGSSVGAVSYGDRPGLSGDGVIAVLTLQPRASSGTATLTLANALFIDSQGQPITPVTEGVTVTLSTSGHRIFLPAVTRTQ